MDKLSEFKAERIKDNHIRDDKIPFLFEMQDKDVAKQCYEYFFKHGQRLKEGGENDFIE